MRNLKFMFLGIGVCLVLVSFRGDVKSAARDFLKIREAYTHTSNLSMDVVYKVFQGPESDLKLDEHTGHYVKMGDDKLYMQLFGTLTIRNKEVIMVKDDSTKTILIKKPSPDDSKQPTIDMEKLLQVCETIETLPNEGTLSGYKLSFSKKMQEMKAIEIYFDSKSYFVQKVIIFYNTELDVKRVSTSRKNETFKPRLEVRYVNINANPDPSVLSFPVDKYIKKEHSKWILQPILKGYHLIDQTSAQSSRP